MKITINIYCISIVRFLFIFILFHLSFISFSQPKTIDSLLLLIDETSSEEIPSVYNQISKSYYNQHQFVQSLKYAQKALNASSSIQKSERLHSYIHIINTYRKTGENHKVISNTRLALSLAEELEDQENLHIIHNLFGNSYSDLGLFGKALEHYFESLKIKEKLWKNDETIEAKKNLSLSFNNIGTVYYELKDYEKAIEYYRKSLKYRIECNHIEGQASTIQNIGLIFSKQRKYKYALDHYQQALDLKKQIPDTLNWASTLYNIGNEYINLKDYKTALPPLLQAAEIWEKYKNKYYIAVVSAKIGEVYLYLKNYGKAEYYLQQGVLLCKESGAKRYLAETYLDLSNYYEQIGNYKKANDELKNAISLKDSLFSLQLVGKTSILEMLYKNEKQKNEILYQELKLSRQKTIIILILILIVLIAAIFSFLWYRSRNKQREKQSILEKKAILTKQQLLRSQMNPHFIFNSMNSIQSYIIKGEKENAMSYLAKFSSLTRSILENSRYPMIPITDEIETLRLYIELEKQRMENGLNYKIESSDDIHTESTYIPPMLIQPIVENALKHGLKPLKDRQASLHIRFSKKGQQLHCIVQDNGIGRKDSIKRKNTNNIRHQSLSIPIIKERLSVLGKIQKKKYSFQIDDLFSENNQAKGTKASIILPFEEE